MVHCCQPIRGPMLCMSASRVSTLNVKNAVGAVDAVVLDNTHLTQDEQVEFVLNEIHKIKNQAKSSI